MARLLTRIFGGISYAKLSATEWHNLRIDPIPNPKKTAIAVDIPPILLFHKSFSLPKYRKGEAGDVPVIGVSDGNVRVNSAQKIDDAFFGLLFPPATDFLPGLDDIEIDRKNDLKPYQLDGISFLYRRTSALLADEMGLGKTLQALFAMEILFRHDHVRRALIICPASVQHHWQSEAKKWVKREATIVNAPAATREHIWRYLSGIIICTPQIIQRDSAIIANAEFDLVVCDDVKPLRNENLTSKAIRNIKRDYSWCLSGTPMATSISNLFNVCEFIKPGLFTRQEMALPPATPLIEKRKAPYYLRRTQEECFAGGEVPSLERIIKTPILVGAQKKAYEHLEKNQWEELQAEGHDIGQIHIFAKINKLIRLCSYDEVSGTSAKADDLEDELENIFDSGDKAVVIFSYMTVALDYLAKRFAKWKPIILDGRVPVNTRQQIIERDFVAARGKIILMQSKIADGIDGLQHRANYIFHFDRQWDPTEQDQGTGRLKRIGSTHNCVYEYVFVTENTIEERIHTRLQQRREDIERNIRSSGKDIASISDADLMSKMTVKELGELLRPS